MEVPLGSLVPAGLLLLVTLFAVRSLHIFSLRNGTFDLFFDLLKKRQLPSGVSFQSIDTRGFSHMIDQQISAFATFMLCFTEDLSHPDTTLCGFLFLGAWGPTWILLVLESFRAANHGCWLSYLALPGYIIFHQSHAFGTPIYLALAILFLPSNAPEAQTTDSLRIDDLHLRAIPISFIIGYIVPIIMMALPAPRLVSYRFKHTATGWYQQWHLIISFIHYTVVWTSTRLGSKDLPGQNLTPDRAGQTMNLLWPIYALTFILAALPYYTVMFISLTSFLAPSLFNPQKVGSLHPKQVLVPTWPSSQKRPKDIREGFKWLIQWDYILGTLATVIWAVTLRLRVGELQEGGGPSLYGILGRAIAYFLIGGPNAIPLGLMWERDELVFATSR